LFFKSENILNNLFIDVIKESTFLKKDDSSSPFNNITGGFLTSFFDGFLISSSIYFFISSSFSTIYFENVNFLGLFKNINLQLYILFFLLFLLLFLLLHLI
jgi:hypothetical protein